MLICIAYISSFNSEQKSMPLNPNDDLDPPKSPLISDCLNITLKNVWQCFIFKHFTILL